jgi:hypothetical protein
LDDALLVAKDASSFSHSEEELQQMHGKIKDRNYRIFTADMIYCFNRDTFVRGQSAGEVFAQLELTDPGHAFYLGRELERAETALALKKRYVQDRPIRWGYLNDS